MRRRIHTRIGVDNSRLERKHAEFLARLLSEEIATGSPRDSDVFCLDALMTLRKTFPEVIPASENDPFDGLFGPAGGIS